MNNYLKITRVGLENHYGVMYTKDCYPITDIFLKYKLKVVIETTEHIPAGTFPDQTVDYYLAYCKFGILNTKKFIKAVEEMKSIMDDKGYTVYNTILEDFDKHLQDTKELVKRIKRAKKKSVVEVIHHSLCSIKQANDIVKEHSLPNFYINRINKMIIRCETINKYRKSINTFINVKYILMIICCITIIINSLKGRFSDQIISWILYILIMLIFDKIIKDKRKEYNKEESGLLAEYTELIRSNTFKYELLKFKIFDNPNELSDSMDAAYNSLIEYQRTN